MPATLILAAGSCRALRRVPLMMPIRHVVAGLDEIATHIFHHDDRPRANYYSAII